MAKIKGVCKNYDECNKAEAKEEQEIERSSPFVCEECGKPLVEVKKSGGGGKDGPPLIPILIGVLLLAGVGVGLYFF